MNATIYTYSDASETDMHSVKSAWWGSSSFNTTVYDLTEHSGCQEATEKQVGKFYSNTLTVYRHNMFKPTVVETLKDHTSSWYYENDVAVLKAICRWLQRNKTDFMAAYSNWYNTGINVWLTMGILWKSKNLVSYWGWHLLLYTYPCCNLL